MKKSVFTGMLLCMVVVTNAQLLLDSLQAVLRPYRAKGIDTIITLTIPSNAHLLPDIDTLEGLGRIFVMERAWLFYKKNHQLVSVKYISGLQDYPSNGGYEISRELVCRNPAPFDWIVQNESRIAADRTLPHIITYKHNNTIVYDERHDRLPGLYFIGIHIHQKSHYFVISEVDLEKHYHPGDAENLNYEHNINSETNKARQHLMSYLEEYDKQYFFPATHKNTP